MIGLDRKRREVRRRAVHRRRGATGSRRSARFRLRHAGHRGRQPEQRFRHAGRRRTTRSQLETQADARALPSAAWSTPASARMRRRRRCGRSSCMSRSSAPAPPASSSRPSCTARRARWWPTGSTASIPRRTSKLTLIEAADRVLPALPPRLSDAATKLLAKLGVSVHTSARGGRGAARRRAAGDGRVLPAELVVWAAGVKAPDFLKDLAGLETNRINQLVVLPDPADRRATTTSSPSATAPPAPGPARQGALRAAARAGRAPAGLARGHADRAPAGRQAAEALPLPRLRLAGVARRVLAPSAT